MPDKLTTTNPTDAWQQMFQQWNTWMSQMQNTQQWMNTMRQWSQMFSPDAFKSNNETWTNMLNQYYELLNNNFARMQESLQNGTVKDVYRNMINASEGFTRFYELWMPMWKSIQEKHLTWISISNG